MVDRLRREPLEETFGNGLTGSEHRAWKARSSRMEAFLHRLFTARSDFPIWVRYTLTLGLVGIAFFARVMLDDHLRSYPVLLFIPAIFLSSVLFDRGSGILTTAAGAALAAAYFIPGPPIVCGDPARPIRLDRHLHCGRHRAPAAHSAEACRSQPIFGSSAAGARA
ncbi:DUF4118 domain-containing protein [Bradyrhizobium vignae]|nr:DUF4118 domain-containing protein [Bradyrhizobium vignae]